MKRHRLLVAVFASMALAGWSQDIIIESFSDGQNSQAFSSVEGKWTESTAKSTAAGLTATKALFNDANTDPAVARFTPQVPSTGQYEVFITYPTSGNATGINYTVVSADGTKVIPITQNGRDFGHSPQANQWFSIGTFTFNAGNSGYIEISDPLTGAKPLPNEPNARIYVDAVKLVPKGAAAPVSDAGAVVSAESEAAAEAMELASASQTPATPTTGLPALPTAAATTPAPADMPGLPAVQAAAAPEPGQAMPGLPAASAQAGVAAQLPGLPAASPAVSAAAALPALPGAATPATAMPGLPATTPQAPAAMPGLPPAPATATAPGLPDLPSPAATDAAGLPALPAAPAATTIISETETVVAQATPYPAPNLPSLAPVTPTPERMLPSPADTPVPGAFTGLPGGALSALPPTPAIAAGVSQTTSFNAMPATPAVPGAPGVPPAPGSTPVQPVAGASISQYNPANLQWMYDFGAALNTARAQNKKVMIFFTAEGNRAASTYQTQYFVHPSVRQALDNYVLVKVDFPKNTRLGYSLGIFGAGIIVITDQTGDVTARIEQLPPTPIDLIKQMAGVKAPQPTPATGATPAPGAPAMPTPPAGAPAAPPTATPPAPQ